MNVNSDLTENFLAWVLQHQALCECCSADLGLAPVRALAGILSGMLEQVDAAVVTYVLSLTPTRARELAPLPEAPPGGLEVAAIVEEVHALLPAVRERYEAWLVDEREIFGPMRRDRCRPLARALKQMGFDGRVDDVEVRTARVREIAAALQRLHHHAFASVLERAGFIKRAAEFN
jgi:hypothetical protein